MAYSTSDLASRTPKGLAFFVDGAVVPIIEQVDDIEDRLDEVYHEIRTGGAVFIGEGVNMTLIAARLISHVDVF